MVWVCHVCLLRPKSTGEVTLNSNDAFDSPKIDPKFFSEREDMNIMIKGYRKMMQIMDAEPLRPFTRKVQDPVDINSCLLYTSPSPRDGTSSRMPSSA